MSNSEDRELAEWGEQRKRRQRLIAWVLVVALVLGGGGATVLGFLFS